MLADLAAPDIEGIYETQMSLEFRALMDLGCLCSVNREDVRRFIRLGTKEMDTFSLEQLEFRTASQSSVYLQNSQSVMKKIFIYQHNIPTAKKEIWGVFMPLLKKGLIIALDSVRTNQMPNIKNMYTSEHIALMKNESRQFELPPEEMNIDILIEVDSKQVYRHIQRCLSQYKQEKKTPTMLCIQTAMDFNKLNSVMSVLQEFPQVQIHIADDASLLSSLDWQRQGCRTMIRHFLNLENVINLMLDQCRYFHLPLGNMPPDTILFGADLFYARLLQKSNFVLWWSDNTRPDLGGREADDSRLLAEFEDNIQVIQNKEGYYSEVCVELCLDSLAVSSLLQANKIQEFEGTASAITFDVVTQASLEEMVGKAPTSTVLPSYDETALCSAAFRVMRSMVNGWLREVSINRNIFSDFQIIHFYRWIKSSNSVLYDPALRRSLNNFMRKMFLRIIAEFKRLGATIIYADFNRIILNSGKKNVADALSYVDYVVQSLRNKEIFHSIHLSYEQCWNFMIWLDSANFSGIKGELPKEVQNTEETQEEDDLQEVNGEEENISLEMNWTVAEHLPEERDCREKFDNLLTLYMQSLSEKQSPNQAIKDISHVAYEYIVNLSKGYSRGKESPAVDFIRTLIKVLSVNKNMDDEINDFRRNMLRFVGIGEFSDLAEWKDPCDSYILNEVICKACNHCRDLDLCKDKHRAMKDGV